MHDATVRMRFTPGCMRLSSVAALFHCDVAILLTLLLSVLLCICTVSLTRPFVSFSPLVMTLACCAVCCCFIPAGLLS